MDQSPRRKKAFAVARDLGLTRDERIELAEYLLRRSIQSWKELSEEQIARLLDAMEGFELIRSLLEMRSGAEDREHGLVAQ